ncbi:MAG: bifunctional riboflavin kinase/FAD synthetase [Candidatus Aminicenantes bacterium]|nr:bifunctional riboflavin kinase/FAD synthetase [Candidatus Aminicenantes bacterium]
MRIFYRLTPHIKSITKNSVLAIGIFDGLHLGHQKILKTVVAKAKKENLPAGVMSFYPHPDRILNHQRIKLIQTLEQRLEFFRKFGLDYCLILSLDSEMASLSGEDFVRLILKDTLQIKQVVVGENFRFGHRRHCGVHELKSYGKKYGFKVRALKPIKKDGHLVSSSLLRRLLEAGRVEEVWKLLGRPYQIQGQVVKGEGVGQKLGFPTANLKTENEILPPGVYISKVAYRNEVFPSVTNIGFRPTFGGEKLLVEAHLLDFSGRLYGKKLSLFLLKKIRPEKKFSSVEKLKEQIGKDIQLAREYFKQKRRTSTDLLDFQPDLAKYKFFKS